MGEAHKGTIISENKINFEKRIYTNFQEGDESEILKWEKTKIGPPEPGGTVPWGWKSNGSEGGPPKLKKKWEIRDFNQLFWLESKEGGSPGPSDPDHIDGGCRGLGGGSLDEEKRKLLQDAKLRTEQISKKGKP